MANIRNYIAANAQANQPVKLYLIATELGNGTLATVEDLHLGVEGRTSIPGLKLKGRLDVMMDGYGPSGRCRVAFTPEGGRPAERWCSYTTSGASLDIDDLPVVGTVTIQRGGENVTWIRILRVWYRALSGVDAALPEGFPDAPDEAEEPAGVASGD